MLATSLPSTRICPLAGSTSRLTILSVVVLPQPLGPTNTQISPGATESERSSTATVPLRSRRCAEKWTVTWRNSTEAPRTVSIEAVIALAYSPTTPVSIPLRHEVLRHRRHRLHRRPGRAATGRGRPSRDGAGAQPGAGEEAAGIGRHTERRRRDRSRQPARANGSRRWHLPHRGLVPAWRAALGDEPARERGGDAQRAGDDA